jgi:hypothetical protein
MKDHWVVRNQLTASFVVPPNAFRPRKSRAAAKYFTK